MTHEVIVVGAGGHAKVCIEILQSTGNKVAFCVGGSESPETCISVPVLKGDHQLHLLRKNGFEKAFVAVGSNELRLRLSRVCIDLGYELVSAVSPFAHTSKTARFGKGVAVMPGAVINAEAHLSDLVVVNTGATVDHDCRVGEAVHVGPQCGLAGNVTVGRLSFLGIGCKVLPGIRIGSGVTVGAGAVVITDVQDDKTIVGVPASVILRNQLRSTN